MAEVLKAGLGQFEVKVRAEEKVRQDGFDEGWEKAIEAASSLYAVTYSCSICGKEMTVQTEEEKEAIREFMTSSGWCHGDCESR